MAIITKSSTTGFSARFIESAVLAFAALRAYGTAYINRRSARRLSELPDYLLKDMGLKRDDIHAALSQDWRSDPTFELAYRAGRRDPMREMRD